jgi:hypothetical protein
LTNNISIATSRVVQSDGKPATDALKGERLDFHVLTIIVHLVSASPKGEIGTTVVKRRLEPQLALQFSAVATQMEDFS